MASPVAIKQAERAELVTESKSIMAAVESAGSFTDAQRERLQAIESVLPGVDADIDLLQRARERIVTAPTVASGLEPAALGFTQLKPYRSIADQVLMNEAFASWMKNGVSRTGRMESPAVLVEGSLLSRPSAAVITGGSATSGGAFVIPDYTGRYDNRFQPRLRLRDLVTLGGTESDTVEYVRVTSVTSNAASVAEATSTDTASEVGLKPESAMAFEVVQPGVKTVAHWVPVTNNALADAKQLRTIIDQFLTSGVAWKMEAEMLSGGGGDEFTGLDITANVQSQDFDTDVLTTTRRALGKVEYGGSIAESENEANGFVFNPLDWVDIDLALTLAGSGTNNRQAATVSVPSLWGIPVVTSKGVSQGTGWVADWKQAILWDREQTIIRVGQPNNFFLKNLNAVLAEARAAFGIVRPSAFCEIDLGGS
jgi:HK97 family phage major capsid protein